MKQLSKLSTIIAMVAIVAIGASVFFYFKSKKYKGRADALEQRVLEDSIFISKIQESSDNCNRQVTESIMYYEEKMQKLNASISKYKKQQQSLNRDYDDYKKKEDEIKNKTLTKEYIDRFFEKY